MILVAGIVTFNPNIDTLNKSIAIALRNNINLIIVDNGSDNIAKIEKLNTGNFRLIANNDNLGIACALNQIAQYANEIGSEWFITFDQDSIVDDCYFQACYEAVNKYRNSEIGIICPRLYDRNSGEFTEAKDEYLDRCITSGSVNSVRAWQAVSGFDDYLFIDEVDHDYCYRIRQDGWRILRYPKLMLNHAMGEIEIKYLFGRRIRIRNYSAFRKYYQIRNYIYCHRKYRISFLSEAVSKLLYWMILVFLFEDQKIEKIKALLQGFIDGFRVNISYSKE